MASMKGGEKLIGYLKMIAAKADTGAVVNIGFPEGSTELDGTSTPLVAAINEFGRPSVGQPPRPFFRRMIKAKSPAWPEQTAKLLKYHNYDGEAALAQMGELIEGQLKSSIIELVDPPLKESTVKAKGFDKPLEDTKRMLANVHHWMGDKK